MRLAQSRLNMIWRKAGTVPRPERLIEIMSKRILIADDDAAVRESFRKILKQHGYEVTLARNGDEALEKLEVTPIDLLLLDLQMPKTDGWDLLEKLGECPLPVILITGLASQLETRLIPGVSVLLEKPVDGPVLLEAVEEALAASQFENRRDRGFMGSPAVPASVSAPVSASNSR